MARAVSADVMQVGERIACQRELMDDLMGEIAPPGERGPGKPLEELLSSERAKVLAMLQKRYLALFCNLPNLENQVSRLNLTRSLLKT